jgi:hypothetical protein
VGLCLKVVKLQYSEHFLVHLNPVVLPHFLSLY